MVAGSAVGIEIRQDSLVLATLKKSFHDFSLRRATVIDRFRELPVPELHAKIRQFVAANGFSRENVILGLPRDEVAVRTIELPFEAEENISQVIRFQVERFEPTEEDRSYYDYSILHRDETLRKITIQLIMVRKSLLDQHLNLLRELNLYPAAARVSSVALHQVFSIHEDGYPKKEPYLVLDVSPAGMEMVVVLGAERFFSEKIFLTESELTAERVLWEADTFLSRLRLPGEGLSKIYVTGSSGGALLEDLRERLGGGCERLLDKVSLRDKAILTDRPEILHAVGLAISGLSGSRGVRFNLVPPDKRLTGQRASLIPTVVLLVLIAALGAVAFARDYLQRRTLLAEVHTQIRALQPRVDQIMGSRQQVAQREAELKELRGILVGNQKVLLVLKDLTERLPDDAFLQNLNIENNRVTLFGYANSGSDLLPILRASSYFKTLDSRFIVRDNALKKERFDFEGVLKE